MKRLYLLRHAKSAWGDPTLSDYERPLAPRGRRATKHVGTFLRDNGHRFDQVLCSAAKRARQTWQRVSKGLSPEAVGSVAYDEHLYMAGAPALLARLQQTDDRVETLLLVAHNPDLETLASELCNSGEGNTLQRLHDKFPTAALADIELDIASWAALAPGCGTLARFTLPRDLEAQSVGASNA